MLTSEQRTQLETTILEFIGLTPSVVNVQELIGARALERLRASDNGAATARWIVDYSLGQPGPEVFIKIVYISDVGEALVELRGLADKLEQDISLWRSTFADDLYVPAEWPFVDRKELRETLHAIATGDGPPAIAVEAAPGYGRRTVCEYIRTRALAGRTYRAVPVELRREPSAGVLDRMVADLCLALGIPLGPGMFAATTHFEPERQGLVLARLLADEAVRAGRTVWLVVNIVEPHSIEPGVLTFLDGLLAAVNGTPLVARRLRVIVLSDNLSGIGLVNLPGPKARHVLADVPHDELTEWFEAAAPGKPRDLYAFTATAVLRAVDDLKPVTCLRLWWLARFCKEAHERLLKDG